VSAARREVDRLRLKNLANAETDLGPKTFGELVVIFTRYRLVRLARTTALTVKHNLDAYLLPRWGDMQVADITPLEIVAWFDELRRGGLSDSIVAKIRANMSQVFRYCQKIRVISGNEEANPVKDAEAPDVTDYRPIVMSPSQVMHIIDQLEGSVRVMALLAAATGLRISEITGLKWCDVDFAGQVIHVRRTWIQGKVSQPKTKSSATPVPLAPALAAALQQWKAAAEFSGPDDWVFASTTGRLRGKRPREGGVAGQDYLRPAAIAAGVIPKGYKGRFGWHNFRHTTAHHLVRSGVGPKVVQGLLRHSKVETTLRYYAQTDPADTLAAQVKMLDDIGLAPGSGVMPTPAQT